jgi:hypothetical protein
VESEVAPELRGISAVADDALGDDDAVGLTSRVRRGEVSAEELRRAAAERIARVDPTLHGLTFDRRDEPVTGNQDSPLVGVPTLVKENSDAAGWPTTNGTTAYVAEPAPANAEVTDQLLDLGVALLAHARVRPQRQHRVRRRRAHPQPLESRLLRRRLLGQVSRAGRRRCGPAGPRFNDIRFSTPIGARCAFRPPRAGSSGSSRRGGGRR